MTHEPPLHGLKVLELASGVAGPYAGRLLAMLGATVVKAELDDGDPARTARIDDLPLRAEPSPLYAHLNAGKRNVRRSALPPSVRAWPDLVIDDRVRTQNPEPYDATVVSVTAWGFDDDDPGRMEDELLVQARSGAIAATGDPGAAPLRLPGWQSQYLAGAHAATFGLLCSRMSRYHHVEVSWLGAMSAAAEPIWSRQLAIGFEPVAQGPHIQAAFPSGAFRCADGHVVVGTVRRHDWEMQCLLYGRPELVEEFPTPAERGRRMDELTAIIQPWYDRHAKRDIFEQGLEVLWAVGMVMTCADALQDPHLHERGFLSGNDEILAPWRTPGLPVDARHVARIGEHDAWFAKQLEHA